jgi:hypothetical protein
MNAVLKPLIWEASVTEMSWEVRSLMRSIGWSPQGDEDISAGEYSVRD